MNSSASRTELEAAPIEPPISVALSSSSSRQELKTTTTAKSSGESEFDENYTNSFRKLRQNSSPSFFFPSKITTITTFVGKQIISINNNNSSFINHNNHRHINSGHQLQQQQQRRQTILAATAAYLSLVAVAAPSIDKDKISNSETKEEEGGGGGGATTKALVKPLTSLYSKMSLYSPTNNSNNNNNNNNHQDSQQQQQQQLLPQQNASSRHQVVVVSQNVCPQRSSSSPVRSSTSIEASSSAQATSTMSQQENSSSSSISNQKHQHNNISFQTSNSLSPSNASSSLSSQGTTSTNMVTSSSVPVTTNPDTRTHVVGELYDTERSYVESLQVLVEKYMKPLKSLESNRILIDSNLVDEIFYTIPEILQHHENFLSSLQDRLSSDWDTSQVIGNVFIEAFTNQQIIDTYTAFINNWKNARQAIKIATQAKPAFERFLEAMSREHKNKLTLDALLIMPVQRIPRYELLIKELIKHTPDNHPDHGPLMIAQKEIHELALKIDRAEKEMIHQEQLKDLECLIEGHVELQNPQRDFIRYDLVTILSASALTVAKKERVLFLFCDLLIMTSVKKKASRRSNLQSAFSNSVNDISLLEGNKFKLLLKVSLDQVEIRVANDQIQIHQQQQQELRKEQQLQIQQRGKIIQEKRREIESDLCILNQIESLTSKVSASNRTKINESINEVSNQLRDRLYSLDQADIKIINDNCNNQHLQIMGQDSHNNNLTISSLSSSSMSLIPFNNMNLISPSQTGSINSPTSQNSVQYQHSNNNNSICASNLLVPSNSSIISNSNSNSSSAVSQQDTSDTSLEFIINTTKDSLNTNLTLSPSATNESSSATIEQNSNLISNSSDNQLNSSSTYETLVVTFPSLDRRQAFLMAFIDAKQQRFNLQNRQKMFSTSVTLKLAPPSSPRNELRRTKLHHQDNITDSRNNFNRSPLKSSNNSIMTTTTRNSSAPVTQHVPCGNSTIVHQMSAPQSLAGTSISPIDMGKERSSSQCTSCSSSNVISNSDQYNHNNLYHQHHHHHHQLMHQPASHPASLDTICCHDQHNDEKESSTKVSSIPHLSKLQEFETDENSNFLTNTNYGQNYYECINKEKTNDCSVINNDNNSNKQNNINLTFQVDNFKQTLSVKTTPTFLVTIPMNFLNTQHPSLQFTCSLLYRDDKFNLLSNDRYKTNENKQQTVRDKSGKIWLCMSNGYVSHVALLSIEGKKFENFADELKNNNGDNIQFKKCHNLIPIVQSSGDICKSNINCAIQVKWSIKSNNKKIINELSKTNNEEEINSKQLLPNVAIKSASPPIDIKQKSNDSNDKSSSSTSLNRNKNTDSRLSESAPTKTENINEQATNQQSSNILNGTSISTTMLEVPSIVNSRNKVTNQQNRNSCPRQIHHTNSIKSDDIKCLRAAHDAVCHRHYHHKHDNYNHNLQTQDSSANRCAHKISNNFINNHSPSNHTHHNHHHHSHHHHQHHHHNHSHNLYSSRHYTVPIEELRRAFERQNKVSDSNNSDSLSIQKNNLSPQTIETRNSLSPDRSDHNESCCDEKDRKAKIVRSTTPPGSSHAGKNFRSARLLRHQASLKTSSILAKLVSGAGKRSSYLKKSNQIKQNQSEDNDTELDNINQRQIGQECHYNKNDDKQSVNNNNNNNSSTNLNVSECFLKTNETNNNLISPLSSISSLNSTNSSITINSACASSPNRSSCDLLVHSLSTSCCAGSAVIYQTLIPTMKSVAVEMATTNIQQEKQSEFERGLRSRSATVPSRRICQQLLDDEKLSKVNCPSKSCKSSNNSSRGHNEKLSNCSSIDEYKVSEISDDVIDVKENSNNSNDDNSKIESYIDEEKETKSSLWLGCDDGSLIIIDCLTKQHSRIQSDCNLCESNNNINNFNCDNVHTEIKLNAPICDICVYLDKLVFVALSNGQLAIFSRKSDSTEDNCNKNGDNNDWSLTNPKLLTVTTNELNSTSKLCLINKNYLWYSYGRNIFVLNVSTFKLETTIMAPTNDLSLQFTKQSIAIDNMELMENLSGVWISFKNSHLIQFYDVELYKLLIEINLFDPINQMLSYGNEIIRQHKTSCLKATSLLNVNNKYENFNTLFIGTSAGIILYINIDNNQLEAYRKHSDVSAKNDFIPQIASLRHGHSGNVKFLHVINIDDNNYECSNNLHDDILIDDNNNNNNSNNSDLKVETKKLTLLVSGGAGVDFYGPNDDKQYSLPQLNGQEDNLNHLLFWKL